MSLCRSGIGCLGCSMCEIDGPLSEEEKAERVRMAKWEEDRKLRAEGKPTLRAPLLGEALGRVLLAGREAAKLREAYVAKMVPVPDSSTSCSSIDACSPSPAVTPSVLGGGGGARQTPRVHEGLDLGAPVGCEHSPEGMCDPCLEAYRQQSEEKTCDGMCDPTCAFCGRMADEAAQNEILKEGY